MDTFSFNIISWLGPSSNIVRDTIFQDMIDAGFTINMSELLVNHPDQVITLPPTTEENLRMLDVAEKVGLKLIIVDSRIDPNKPLDSIAYQKLDSVIMAYKNHKAFFGYFIYDEPKTSLFDNIAKIKNYLVEKDPQHLAYVNLFPIYVYPSTMGVPTYEEYVYSYLEKVKPQILSFDIYCFWAGELRPMYFENLDIIRNAALSENIPFWAFTLSTPHYLYDMPTEGEISFQLYCDLAYGAKGLVYFTYGFIPNLSTLAPIDSLGNKTQIWYIAKNINSDILHLSTILKTLHCIDVFHTEPLPQGTHGLPENFYITSTDTLPMVMGYFKNKEGSPYIMLVNRMWDQNISVKLSVSDSLKSIIEIGKESGIELPALAADSNNNIKLDFKPGEGRLFRIQKFENKYLEVSSDSLFIDALSNRKASFEINSNTLWKIYSDQTWFTLSSDSGFNNANITIDASINTLMQSRAATITISGDGIQTKTITLIQSFRNDGFFTSADIVFAIFPNPVNDRLTVSLTNQIPIKTIEIYSLNGKLIYAANVESDQIEIDMRNFQDGIYFLKINTLDKTVTRKVVKIANH